MVAGGTAAVGLMLLLLLWGIVGHGHGLYLEHDRPGVNGHAIVAVHHSWFMQSHNPDPLLAHEEILLTPLTVHVHGQLLQLC